LSAAASPQTPLGELTALAQTLQLYLWGLLLKEAGEGTGETREGEWRGEEGREGVHPLPYDDKKSAGTYA